MRGIMSVHFKISEANVTNLFMPIKAIGFHNIRRRSDLCPAEFLGGALGIWHGGQRSSAFLRHLSRQSVGVVLLAHSVRPRDKCWPWLAHQWSCWGTGSLEVWETKRNPSCIYFLENNQPYWLLSLTVSTSFPYTKLHLTCSLFFLFRWKKLKNPLFSFSFRTSMFTDW